jgi:ABC-type glycerol-3-phosphate transport system substrate-binding protein
VKLPLIAALVLGLGLAACGSTGNTPEAQCQRQAEDDPAVVDIYTRTNGAYTQPWAERDQLIRAKKEAFIRCMRAKGLLPPGGVEPVVR